MEKFKITADDTIEIQNVVLSAKSGGSVEVKRHISYIEKEAMAFELSVYKMILDEDIGIAYDNYKKHLIEAYLIAKYYTNIDVDEMKTETDWAMLFDWLVCNEVYSDIKYYISDDYSFVCAIAEDMSGAMRRTFEQSRCLPYKLMKAFGSLLTDEDLSETIAKSADVNNQLVELLDAAKETGKKQNKVQTNSGIVVNLAKKKK